MRETSRVLLLRLLLLSLLFSALTPALNLALALALAVAVAIALALAPALASSTFLLRGPYVCVCVCIMCARVYTHSWSCQKSRSSFQATKTQTCWTTKAR